MANYNDRYPDNISGAFYVDDNCIDCDLCRERAPEIFVRNDFEAHSFVIRQPATPEEIAICEEALDSCPAEAIGNGGATMVEDELATLRA
jgi:ferredoxin